MPSAHRTNSSRPRRNAEHRRDHEHRQRRREIAEELELRAPADQLARDLAAPRLELRDRPTAA